MCTASWSRRDDGYVLVFSRDESRLRGRAEPPRRHDLSDRDGESTAALAPVDSDAGGTWLAVNEHGLTVGLLNRYHAAPSEPPEGWTSRGLLVLELAALPGVDAALARLTAHALRRFRPCTVLLIDPRVGPVVVDWAGATLDGDTLDGPRPVAPPLVSSGYDAFGAARAREEVWRALVGAGSPAVDTPAPDTATLLAFHRDHRPERGPFSTCMHRDDASTVSLTRVDVDLETVAMAYADGPPCTTDLSEPLRVPRAVQSRAGAAAPAG